jgi:hypothetical protein
MWFLSLSEENKLKKIFVNSIKKTAEDYVPILENHAKEIGLYHSEADVRNRLYYNIIKEAKNSVAFKKLNSIVLSEYWSSIKGKRIDFGIYNFCEKEEKVISAVEIKFRYDGLGEKRFKKVIKNDLIKLNEEYKKNKNGAFFILFIHARKYENNKILENKKETFNHAFNDLKKECNIKAKIKFFYVQKNLPDKYVIFN